MAESDGYDHTRICGGPARIRKVVTHSSENAIRFTIDLAVTITAMTAPLSHDAIQAEIEAVLRGEQADATFNSSKSRALVIRVVPVKTTNGARPDGLKDDAPQDVGFSFAVAEADLEIDTTHLSPQQIAAVHQVLWMAGTDDWMDYSHLLTHDAAEIKAGETLALRFSSAAKGARVVGGIFKSKSV